MLLIHVSVSSLYDCERLSYKFKFLDLLKTPILYRYLRRYTDI